MVITNGSRFQRFLLLFFQLAWCSVAIIVLGIDANVVVKVANGGRMPVAMSVTDIFFSIGETSHTLQYFPTDLELADDARHEPLTEKTRLRFLSDRIHYSFGHGLQGSLTSSHMRVGLLMRLPIGDEGIASLGDVLMWSGALLGLCCVTALSTGCFMIWFLKYHR